MNHKSVVIAPDSFKESLTAKEVADAIESGFKEVFPEWTYHKVPMADGGEGTVQSIVDGTGGKIISLPATDPLGRTIDSFYGITGDGSVAIIEMAAAAGLDKLDHSERNPMLTTTWGVGDLIKDALDKDVNTIIIAIGGSATNDGGAGMIQSLGGELLDKNGNDIPYGARGLFQLDSIDLSNLDTRLQNIEIRVACDVDNPLTGPKGASYVYGPQKGANELIIDELEAALLHYEKVLESELRLRIKDVPGLGAAGGLGAGLYAFLKAELVKGGQLVSDILKLADVIKTADLVITGEGEINHQTVHGKTPITVAKIAKEYDVPVLAIAGSLGQDYESIHDHGIDSAFSVIPKLASLDTLLEDGYVNIRNLSKNLAVSIKMMSEKGNLIF